MEIFAPKYCKDFKCIADKCRHSCCVDWEIDIDGKTYEKYASLKSELGKSIVSKINNTDEKRHFILDKNGRCPNLDEKGLCKIITELGEEYLCDICRLHPRFFNRVGGRIEMGIGLSCEEAVRLALTEDDGFRLVKIGENDEKCIAKASDFDAIAERDSVISCIENRKESLFQAFKRIEGKYEIDTEYSYSESKWIEYLLTLEILDGEWKSLLEKSKNIAPKRTPKGYDKYYENLFKYFLFRYASRDEDRIPFSYSLGFSVLCVKLVKYLAEREEKLTEERFFEIVRLFSSEIEYSEENVEDFMLELEISMM
ncbi:MAG: hypothetical protein E7673_00860 [Ruminococcaceae bacterium]|nr:hypothetical protein [Oscillospiraceae bacterium]